MIELKSAVEIARKAFVSGGYLDKVICVYDLPEKWIFFGRMKEGTGTEYGNCPVTVNKTTGAVEWYRINSPVNISEASKANPIALPA